MRREGWGGGGRARDWQGWAAPAWRLGKRTGGGGLAQWADCFGLAQCEQSYFLFIQTIVNCPKFESTKWRSSQT
jgi:hypothetical protein